MTLPRSLSDGIPVSQRRAARSNRPHERGYLLMECLVYIGVLGVVLGVGYAALYQCIGHSVALRRNADDLTAALHAGERWREDVRSTRGRIDLEDAGAGQVLRLPQARGEITYRFAEQSVFRRVDAGTWVRLLTNVHASAMMPDPRQHVTVWRWDLELQRRARASRIRPLFTFLSLPENTSAP